MHQDLVHIGEVIVHGVLFDPKNTEAWRNMDVVENIYRSVPRLFDLLDERGAEYVLVGGIAMLAYIEGRRLSRCFVEVIGSVDSSSSS